MYVGEGQQVKLRASRLGFDARIEPLAPQQQVVRWPAEAAQPTAEKSAGADLCTRN